MVVTVLGCGTSTGVPIIGCSCDVCRSRDRKDNRLRASILVSSSGRNILVDTSTDLRQQALRAKLTKIDAVLLTHPHADHISGIDELRTFNFMQQTRIPVYGNEWSERELLERFSYIFKPNPLHKGGGIPQLDFARLQHGMTTVIAGLPVTPLTFFHGDDEVFGYRFGSFAYVTDISRMPPETEASLKGLSSLILDCVRLKKHGTHLNFEEAMEIIDRLRPKKTYLTHMGHDFKYSVWARKLPKGVYLAFDGLKIRIPQLSKEQLQ